MKKLFIFLCMAAGITAFSATTAKKVPAGKDNFEINIIHINDHHSHLEAEKMDLVLGGKKTKVTIGGIGRVASKVKELRAKEKNPLVLHAGDAMTGTLYYTLFNGVADAEEMNSIGFDAFTLGNHEFDGGNEGLLKFLNALKVPVVSSNVVPEEGSILAGKWTPYIIKNVNGEKIGIIGLDIVGKTRDSSNPGKDIKFEDEVTTVQKYADELAAKGINKIILLSHFGYENNVDLAKKVSGIDVIVSGDTHYLLDRNFEKFGLKVEGDYPTGVTSKTGEPVYVVEAWNYSYVVGHLKVVFDKNGVIKSVAGTPQLLLGDDFFERRNESGEKYQIEGAEKQEVLREIAVNPELSLVKPDAKAETILKKYSDQKQELGKIVIGTVKDEIPGGSENRIPDAKNPNGSYATQLVAESMLYTLQHMGTGEADLVIQNSGGVRISIMPGEFTYDSGYTLLPFSNTLYTLKMTGAEIKAVLEDALDFALKPGGSTGSFPYGAGIRYEAKKAGTLGNRVTKVEVKDRQTGKWTNIDPKKMYVVGTNAYIAGGKDGYVTFGKVNQERGGTDTYLDDAKSFIDYVKEVKEIKKPDSTGVKFTF